MRRVRIVHEGRAALDVLLTIGAPVAAVGILTAPVLAAFAALVTESTIEVEKMEKL